MHLLSFEYVSMAISHLLASTVQLLGFFHKVYRYLQCTKLPTVILVIYRVALSFAVQLLSEQRFIYSSFF